MPNQPAIEAAEAGQERKSSRRCRVIGGVILTLIAGTLLTPTVMTASWQQDPLLNWILHDPYLVVESEEASMPLLGSVKVHGFHLTDADARNLDVKIEHIASDASWPAILFRSPDLGGFQISGLDATLKLPLVMNDSFEVDQDGQVLLHGELHDSSLTLADQHANPLVQFVGIDTDFSITRSDRTRLLQIRKANLVDHETLSPDLMSELIGAIAPEIAAVTESEGVISLEIDGCSIPLDLDTEEEFWEQVEVAGRLTLHSVRGRPTTPFLANMLKLHSRLSGRQATEAVQLADECVIEFRVSRNGLFHEGLKLSLHEIEPGLKIESRGTVDADGHLDLTIVAPTWLVEELPGESVSSESTSLHITGSVDDPHFAKAPSL